MTITQLEYIVAVHTHQNFALAAQNCGVTQPTLSMQIKKLEEDLGVIIFDRSKKPVISTDAGRQIINHAKTTLTDFNQMNDII